MNLRQLISTKKWQLQKQETIEEKEQMLKEIAKEKTKGKIKDELKALALFLALLASAVGGRVALQYVPSVEPIIPLAIIAGLIFGVKEGFLLGGTAYIISNFFIWGMQGPWTIFQAFGAAMPGAFAGIWGKLRIPNWKDVMILSVIGTAFFEMVMNIAGPLMGIGLTIGLFAIPLYFITSLPFSIVHVGSNAIFARIFSPLLKLRRKKDEFKIISIARSNGSERTNIRMYKSEQ